MFLVAIASARSASAAVLPSSDINDRPQATALIFYAQPQLRDDMWPLLFQILLADLAAGDGELRGDHVLDKDPVFLRGSDNLRGILFTSIVSVKLLGRCDALPPLNHAASASPLGWVLRVSGKVQPYIYIDCARIAQVIRPATAGMTKQQRQHAMAQAISRVLIHEWVHIVTQISTHSARGLTQSNLSINDLIAEPKNNHLSASTARLSWKAAQ